MFDYTRLYSCDGLNVTEIPSLKLCSFLFVYRMSKQSMLLGVVGHNKSVHSVNCTIELSSCWDLHGWSAGTWSVTFNGVRHSALEHSRREAEIEQPIATAICTESLDGLDAEQS